MTKLERLEKHRATVDETLNRSFGKISMRRGQKLMSIYLKLSTEIGHERAAIRLWG